LEAAGRNTGLGLRIISSYSIHYQFIPRPLQRASVTFPDV
jgi:hypothetical protein